MREARRAALPVGGVRVGEREGEGGFRGEGGEGGEGEEGNEGEKGGGG